MKHSKQGRTKPCALRWNSEVSPALSKVVRLDAFSIPSDVHHSVLTSEEDSKIPKNICLTNQAIEPVNAPPTSVITFFFFLSAA